jgi:predicted HTH transcriptional regulator
VLSAVFALLLLACGLASYVSGATFLRRYLLFNEIHPHTVGEALKLGEGASVEFKRSISFDSPGSVEQILRTVVAFANSGDGTIFVGVEDDGKIRGIKLDTAQEKDRLSQRIHQVVRHRIKPSPLIQVDFVDVRGILVCRIFVPRGEEPLYFLDGVIYVRDGPTDIKAQPEIVKRLLAAHAF